MKPATYKRVIAYVIDLIIVAIISNLLAFNVYNDKKYQEASNDYNTLLQQLGNNEISQEEFYQESNDKAYDLSKVSIAVTIVTEVLTIIAVVVVPNFMNGQTLGKKIMRLKIVSNSDKKLTMNNYLIRGLLNNSILINFISIVSILLLSKNMYLQISNVVTTVIYLFFMVSISLIIFKDDKRGLHDIIAGTKVINAKYKEEYVSETEEEKEKKDPKLEDAEIIGEKKLKM